MSNSPVRIFTSLRRRDTFQPCSILREHFTNFRINVKRRYFGNTISISDDKMMNKEKVAAMREDYRYEEFGEEDLKTKEPFGLFDLWFRMAVDTFTDRIGEANAMTLSTASKEGKPSSRIVLCKGYDKEGFVFFTNYESRKGKELAENPYASLLFYWHPLHRQVRVNGHVQKISKEESEKYFHSRPRKSQIGAMVSSQSQVIQSREVLSSKEKELNEKYKDESVEIPKPDYWGGFVVKPEAIEFWCGRSSRLHDRILFRKPKDGEIITEDGPTKKGEDGWVYERLSP